jgi:preprotein translocase subunit SecE
MEKLRAYFADSYQELVEKTTWPSWKDLWSSSVVVAIASVIIALIIFGMDKVISTVLELVYDIFR